MPINKQDVGIDDWAQVVASAHTGSYIEELHVRQAAIDILYSPEQVTKINNRLEWIKTDGHLPDHFEISLGWKIYHICTEEVPPDLLEIINDTLKRQGMDVCPWENDGNTIRYIFNTKNLIDQYLPFLKEK